MSELGVKGLEEMGKITLDELKELIEQHPNILEKVTKKAGPAGRDDDDGDKAGDDGSEAVSQAAKLDASAKRAGSVAKSAATKARIIAPDSDSDSELSEDAMLMDGDSDLSDSNGGKKENQLRKAAVRTSQK